jgi:uncharacterized protein
MSKHYGTIAFTDDVRAVQRLHGSGAFYDRKPVAGKASPGADPLTAVEQDYLAHRGSFYLATVSETGWPYVQFRGGPISFLRVLNENTVKYTAAELEPALAALRDQLAALQTENADLRDKIRASP